MSEVDDSARSHSVEPVQLFDGNATPTQRSVGVDNSQPRNETTPQSSAKRPKQPFSKSLIRKRKIVLSSDESASSSPSNLAEDITMEGDRTTNQTTNGGKADDGTDLAKEPSGPTGATEDTPTDGDTNPTAKKPRLDNSLSSPNPSQGNGSSSSDVSDSNGQNNDSEPSPPHSDSNTDQSTPSVTVLIENLQQITKQSELESAERDDSTMLTFQRPKSKYTIKNDFPGSIGRDEAGDTIYDHSKRALAHLMFRRQPKQQCFKQTEKSHCCKQCLCVDSQLCKPIRADLADQGVDPEVDGFDPRDERIRPSIVVVQKKWLPVLRSVLEIAAPIALDCVSEGTYYEFLSKVIPISDFHRSNAPKFLLDTGVTLPGSKTTLRLYLCYSAFEEMMGRHPWRKHFFLFQYRFCSGTEAASAGKSPTKTPEKARYRKEKPPSAKKQTTKQPNYPTLPEMPDSGTDLNSDPQSYILHYAKPRALRAWTYQHIVGIAISKGRIPGFAEFSRIGTKKEELISGNKTLALAREIGLNPNDNYVEATFGKVRDPLKTLPAQGLYIIAHGAMATSRSLTNNVDNPRSIKRHAIGDSEGSASCHMAVTRRGVSTSVTIRHSANLGVIDATLYSEAFSCIHRAASHFGGANCYKEDSEGKHRIPCLRGCPNLRCLETQPGTDSAPLLELLDRLGIDDGDLREQLELTLSLFVTDLRETCHALLPWEKRKSKEVQCDLVMTAAYMESTYTAAGYTLSLQLSNLILKPDLLLNLLDLGIQVFIATHPVTEEGAHLRVHEKFDEEDEHSLQGKVVFIPGGHVFIQPATMVHADGFRTGQLGNPRLRYLVFLIPKTLQKEQWESKIAANFDPHYFGVERSGCHTFTLIDGRVPRKDVKNKDGEVIEKAGKYRFPSSTSITSKAHSEDCASHVCNFVDAMGL